MIENGKYTFIYRARERDREKSKTEWMKDGVRVKDQVNVECIEMIVEPPEMKIGNDARRIKMCTKVLSCLFYIRHSLASFDEP